MILAFCRAWIAYMLQNMSRVQTWRDLHWAIPRLSEKWIDQRMVQSTLRCWGKSIETGAVKRKLQRISIRYSIFFKVVSFWSHTHCKNFGSIYRNIPGTPYFVITSSSLVAFSWMSSTAWKLVRFKWDVILEEEIKSYKWRLLCLYGGYRSLIKVCLAKPVSRASYC